MKVLVNGKDRSWTVLCVQTWVTFFFFTHSLPEHNTQSWNEGCEETVKGQYAQKRRTEDGKT